MKAVGSRPVQGKKEYIKKRKEGEAWAEIEGGIGTEKERKTERRKGKTRKKNVREKSSFISTVSSHYRYTYSKPLER